MSDKNFYRVQMSNDGSAALASAAFPAYENHNHHAQKKQPFWQRQGWGRGWDRDMIQVQAAMNWPL